MGIYQGSKLMSGGGGGPSPYEIANQNGYNGTEQAFNQLLAVLDQNATKGELSNKADLVNGKVPAEQLPTMDYATKGELSNKADLVDVKVPESQLPSTGGFKPQIIVTAPTGSTVTAMLDSKTYTATESSGTWTFDVDKYGVYTVTGTLGANTASKEVEVNVVQRYAVELSYSHIYGVEWDGTSTSVWSRTDKSASFVNPTPYVAGASNYGSPFDNLYPWNGMVRVTDSTAGELVAIPKFWYKWTRSGNTMKLQIADKYIDGFSVSPAHMDRGDGKGERDIVYVGRYHCDTSYKSATGNSPKANITRATARSNIHKLGNTYWQFDYATLWTIQMLYLVEYGDWNTQKTIGYGGGNGSGAQAVGTSDSMPYHTGTMQSSRSTYGVGCQYRHIEDLWGNVFDWCDGIYFSGATIYGILNPANFSDSSKGTKIGTRPTSSSWISAYGAPTASGFEWALYPSEIKGSESTYVCDYYYYNSSGVTLRFGGGDRDQNRGLFCVSGYSDASNSHASIGCRLMKLP